MSYEEAVDAIVTRQEALREIRRHGLSEQEFLEEVGDRATYRGKEVLDWMGY